MKIALCLSGQPRGLTKNIDHLIANIIEPSGIKDIFIHMWFDESFVGLPFTTAQPAQFGKLGYWEADTVDKLKKLKPKYMLVEPPKLFEEFSNLEAPESAVQPHIASNAYSIEQCNLLKCKYEKINNFKYDIVIRTRVDCLYEKPYDVKQYLDDDWKNSIHVAYKHQHMRYDDIEAKRYSTKNGEYYGSLSDTFVYGFSNTIDKFCSVFSNFKNIYNDIIPNAYGECYYGYQITKTHKVNISMQNINYILTR